MRKILKKTHKLSQSRKKFCPENEPIIDFLALVEANKDKIEGYQVITTNTNQIYDTKVRINISIRCPQRSFPPIQIDSELYAIGTGEKQPDEKSLKLTCRVCQYKLHARRGAQTFFYEFNTVQAQQVYEKMYELYNNKHR